MERGATPNRGPRRFRLSRSRRWPPTRCFDSGSESPGRRECSPLVAEPTPGDSRRNVPAVPRRRGTSGTEDAEAATWWKQQRHIELIGGLRGTFNLKRREVVNGHDCERLFDVS